MCTEYNEGPCFGISYATTIINGEVILIQYVVTLYW